MNKNIIKNYVNNLTKEDILSFASKENITINTKELNTLYSCIKNDTDLILNNFNSYIIHYKGKLNDDLYNTILEKYEKYKKFIE